MSYDRNIKWLNDRRVIYRREPVNDIPTIETDQYMFYENGTYQHYHLFNSKAKITTYRSLKWHMLVIYHLNKDNKYSLSPFFEHVARFIANKENGFVTFFISQKVLNDMINDVYKQDSEDSPKNKLRKVIFKIHSGLNLSEKLKIVGKLIGRSKLDKEQIYECMLDLNHMGKKITISRIAGLLECSARTIYRHMCNDLKHEKYILNEEV
jgi:hypothetical protein|tara:strand:+ start:821 stop:1447 length:627 start_codon:yes stop_codon:yes gene_type:complete